LCNKKTKNKSGSGPDLRRCFDERKEDAKAAKKKMILLVALLASVSGVAGKGFSLDTYSAMVSSTYGTVKSAGVLSMVPDPNTDDAQPIVALNLSTSNMILVGGVRSYVGGVAQLPYSFSQGDRRLDLFDFTRGGWPSQPSTVVTKSGSITTYTSNCSIATGCSYLYGAYLQLATYPGSTVALNVNSRRNIPLSINITIPALRSSTRGRLTSLTTTRPPTSSTTRSTRSAPTTIRL
jgi:hypothetical protein